MIQLDFGEDEEGGFVYGKTPENARMLLAAAERLGMPPEVVRASDEGFYVPLDLVNDVLPDSPVKEG